MSSMFHSTNPSEYPESWDYYDWPVAPGIGPYCGECGTDDIYNPDGHDDGCTVADDMWEWENIGLGYDTIAEQTDDDR